MSQRVSGPVSADALSPSEELVTVCAQCSAARASRQRRPPHRHSQGVHTVQTRAIHHRDSQLTGPHTKTQPLTERQPHTVAPSVGLPPAVSPCSWLLALAILALCVPPTLAQFPFPLGMVSGEGFPGERACTTPECVERDRREHEQRRKLQEEYEKQRIMERILGGIGGSLPNFTAEMQQCLASAPDPHAKLQCSSKHGASQGGSQGPSGQNNHENILMGYQPMQSDNVQGSRSDQKVTGSSEVTPRPPRTLRPRGTVQIKAEPADPDLYGGAPSDSLLQFTMPENTRPDRVAQLRILVRYKPARDTPPTGPRAGTRQRLEFVIDKLPAQQPVATLTVQVRHTQWQSILLPARAIQEALSEPGRLLSLRVNCTTCTPEGAAPVLLFRGGKQHRRSAAQRGGNTDTVGDNTDTVGDNTDKVGDNRDPGERERRRRARRQERQRSKRLNKHRPYLQVQVRVQRDSGAPSERRSLADARQQLAPVGALSDTVARSDGEARARRHASDIMNDPSPVEVCAPASVRVDLCDKDWSWVLEPRNLTLHYCAGACPGHVAGHRGHRDHTGEAGGSRSPCCRPLSFIPRTTSILYLNGSGEVARTHIDTPIIKHCTCACD